MEVSLCVLHGCDEWRFHLQAVNEIRVRGVHGAGGNGKRAVRSHNHVGGEAPGTYLHGAFFHGGDGAVGPQRGARVDGTPRQVAVENGTVQNHAGPGVLGGQFSGDERAQGGHALCHGRFRRIHFARQNQRDVLGVLHGNAHLAAPVEHQDAQPGARHGQCGRRAGRARADHDGIPVFSPHFLPRGGADPLVGVPSGPGRPRPALGPLP